MIHALTLPACATGTRLLIEFRIRRDFGKNALCTDLPVSDGVLARFGYSNGDVFPQSLTSCSFSRVPTALGQLLIQALYTPKRQQRYHQDRSMPSEEKGSSPEVDDDGSNADVDGEEQKAAGSSKRAFIPLVCDHS